MQSENFCEKIIHYNSKRISNVRINITQQLSDDFQLSASVE